MSKKKIKKKYKYNALQDAWLQGLESGKFKQAEGALATKEVGKLTFSYCCLGVACEVYNEIGTGKKLNIDKSHHDNVSFKESMIEATYDGEYGLLPLSVSKALKLNDNDGTLIDSIENKGRLRNKRACADSEVDSLVDMNDNGYTHKQIAAYIRANPENVFKDAK